MDVTQIVKARVPAEQLPDDPELALRVAEIGILIKNYCNITVIPEALVFTYADMVIDAISSVKSRAILQPDGETGSVVKSVKEGDVQVTFESAKAGFSELNLSDLLFSYREQLNLFRKVRW